MKGEDGEGRQLRPMDFIDQVIKTRSEREKKALKKSIKKSDDLNIRENFR